MAIYAHTQSIGIHKKQMIIVAKDLCYGQDVIEAINAATSVQQVTNILNRARKNGMYEDRCNASKRVNRKGEINYERNRKSCGDY